MPGEREARGKGIHSEKKTLDLHEMDSLPLAASRRSAGKDKCFHLNARRRRVHDILSGCVLGVAAQKSGLSATGIGGIPKLTGGTAVSAQASSSIGFWTRR